ncbi:hypothetical protein [Propionispora hippei]|uniref:Stage III sporulation protein AG n=1 Tax=Propionispora hippei DSM 15287 TaxID=1123003 RepID=A0A1M6NJE7_9FIRM|nr:hypothetical protein [Propionispora hippei]SHJ95878.1 stage III sporulation protein AG [Propionispora hippei DSM 15287]
MRSLEEIVNKGRALWPFQLVRQGVITTRLIWLGILGVALLLVSHFFEAETVIPRTKEPAEIGNRMPVSVQAGSYEEMLEEKLANLLSKVNGAGAVTVSVTLEAGNTQEHAKNVTKETKTVSEKDTTGGVRTTTEVKETEQVLITREAGADKPVVVREIKPEIKGVLVVADGAYDSTVKANLIKAIEGGLGIPPYKITVLPQKR